MRKPASEGNLGGMVEVAEHCNRNDHFPISYLFDLNLFYKRNIFGKQTLKLHHLI
jgi:hypothetical protein